MLYRHIPRASAFLGLLLLIGCWTAQAAVPGFFQVYGEPGRELGDDVVQLADGSYVVVGSTRSFGSGNNDVWAARLDENGHPVWRHTYGGTDNEAALSVTASGDGGVIFTAFIGAGSFGGSAQDTWVVRLAADGSIVWQKIFSGPGFDQFRAVKRLPDGSFALAGFRMPGTPVSDLWMARIDFAGNTIWENVYPAASFGMGLAVSSDGHLLVTGIADSASSDLLLAKIDASNGSVIWARSFDGGGFDRGNDLVGLPSGDIVVSGQITPLAANASDAWVFKTDGFGSVLWETSFGGPGSDSSSGVAYADGDVVVAGSSNFNSPSGENFGFMARLDGSSGMLHWRRSLGGMDQFNTALGLDITLDGGAVATGTMNTGATLGSDRDIYIAKLDPAGTELSCPALPNAPAAPNATFFTDTALPLTSVPAASTVIHSTANPVPAPLLQTLACLGTPVDFLDHLVDELEVLSLPMGMTRKVEDAISILSDGNPNNDHVAINKLNDFISQVEAKRGKSLSDTEADYLVELANQAIAILLVS